MRILMLGLTLAGLIVACQNLRYGQVDCATLEGRAARLCQEYRLRKADADIRDEAAKLLASYQSCLKRREENASISCDQYLNAIRALDLKPVAASQ